MRRIELYIRYVIWALGRVKHPHLFDVVEYRGINCSLIQGRNKPRWDLLPLTIENLARQEREILKGVHEDNFKLKNNFKAYRFRFKMSLRFQIQNWMAIDKRSKIGTGILYKGN